MNRSADAFDAFAAHLVDIISNFVQQLLDIAVILVKVKLLVVQNHL